jgi:hypothetical protein
VVVVVAAVVVVVVEAGRVVEVADVDPPAPVAPVLAPAPVDVPDDPVPRPGVPVVEVVVVLSGAARSPLLLSTVSICCCTPFTTAATAAGVPCTPSRGRTLSSLKICSSWCSTRSDGAAFNVTTIWSARAVVVQAGQFELSALASLTGAMTLLCPTMSTTWKETATVVHAWHLPVADALFVGVTA